MALTATAPSKVVEVRSCARPCVARVGVLTKVFVSYQSVKKTLNISHARMFQMSQNRRNLYFEVRPKAKGKDAAYKALYDYIATEFDMDTVGIVYCTTQQVQ